MRLDIPPAHLEHGCGGRRSVGVLTSAIISVLIYAGLNAYGIRSISGR